VTDTIEETVEGVPEPVPEPDYHEMTRILMAEIRETGRPQTGWFVGRDVFLLTTTGAKSGEPRTIPLAYSRDGDAYVVTASKGGAPTHPAWYFNLLADPTATIEADLQTIKVRASVAKGTERQRLWDQHVAIHTGIGEYPSKTDRIIPVVVLERI
jgi:deazaflavin-dependent oxidoreductase (nitroreductase family)